MPEPTPALVRAVGEAIEDACLQHLGRDVGTIHRDDIARAAIAAIDNPPGSTREQLPADLLALLPARSYLSTACETARLLEGAAIAHPDRATELRAWRDRMHGRCRLTHKFTGRPCTCPCHQTAEENPR